MTTSGGGSRTTASGVHYRVGGAGRPLLLVMGLGGSGASWPSSFVAALERDRLVVRPDNRGTGFTPLAGADPTLDDMLVDLVGVLDDLGTQRADVVGVSLGGMVALLLALDHPDRVGALILSSTTACRDDEAAPPTLTRQEIADGATTDDPTARLAALARMTGPGWIDSTAGRAMLMEMAERAAEVPPTPPAVVAAQARATAGFDVRPRLPTVAAPTLVLHGTHDMFPLAHGHRLAESIPRARLEVFEGVGHMLPWEAPERATALIRAFLAQPQRDGGR